MVEIFSSLYCVVWLDHPLLVFLFYLPERLIVVDSSLHVPSHVLVFYLVFLLRHLSTCLSHYRASHTKETETTNANEKNENI